MAKNRYTKSKMHVHSNRSHNHRKTDYQNTRYKIKRLVESSETVVFGYEDYKDSYDYVQDLFPSLDITNVKILKPNLKNYSKYGFAGAAGFYDKIEKVIIVSPENHLQQKSKFSFSFQRDEVITHELLHYCYFEEGRIANNREMAEEFAYGWSYGYLNTKGYDDKSIIESYMPFLVTLVNKKSFEQILNNNNISRVQFNLFDKYQQKMFYSKHKIEIEERMYKNAFEIGQYWINKYSEKISNNEKPGFENNGNRESRTSFLDFDD